MSVTRPRSDQGTGPSSVVQTRSYSHPSRKARSSPPATARLSGSLEQYSVWAGRGVGRRCSASMPIR